MPDDFKVLFSSKAINIEGTEFEGWALVFTESFCVVL